MLARSLLAGVGGVATGDARFVAVGTGLPRADRGGVAAGDACFLFVLARASPALSDAASRLATRALLLSARASSVLIAVAPLRRALILSARGCPVLMAAAQLVTRALVPLRRQLSVLAPAGMPI